MFAYWNGKIVDDSEIVISPFDLGVLRGYGVFDVMRTENQKVFNFEKHWQRFNNSAATLGLVVPVGKEECRVMLTDLIERNQHPDIQEFNIRMVLTGGVSADGFHPTPGKENMFVLFTPFVPLAGEVYTNGAKLITCEYQRNLPQAKITNYIL